MIDYVNPLDKNMSHYQLLTELIITCHFPQQFEPPNTMSTYPPVHYLIE